MIRGREILRFAQNDINCALFTRIKICGIINVENAHAAVNLGADALGLIFVPGTSRYIEPQIAKRIINQK